MADPIRISNFYSSFDTEAIISQLTAVRSVQITKLTSLQTTATMQKTALADLQAKFSSLLMRAGVLSDAASVSGATASVDGSGVSAAAAPGAALGSFTVAVSSLATGTAVTGNAISAGIDAASLLKDSNFNIPVAAGTFTIKTATGGSTTITVDPATQSLNDVVAAINGAGIGVTASIENDANGRPNLLKLDSTQGAMTLGTAADTSNFLTATNLIASTGTTSRQSTLTMARINPGAKLDTAPLAGGPLAAGDHTFTINGVSIAYNTANDTLQDVLNRINGSAAGVSARYDSTTDTIRLQQTKTGSIEMTLADDGAGGDFLQRTGLLSAPQQLGANAAYSIDGGPTQYSATNSVTVNGATVTLNAVTAPGTPAKVTVGQDTAGAIAAVKNFVTEFNLTLDTIRAVTKADKTSSGILSGDSNIRALQSQLRSMITSAAANPSGAFRVLSEIGISFGKPGAALGSTDKLQFDEDQFKAALARDPVSVQGLLSEFKLGASLEAGGTGSLASISGDYVGSKAGTYAVTDDGAGNLTAVFTPADGTAAVTTTGTIAAGGTNTTLIPGLTLTAGALLQAGTHTVVVSPSSQSVVQKVKGFLDSLSGANGVFQKRQEAYDARVEDLDKRKEQIQDSIDREMERLRAKFRAMEQAQARAESALSALTSAAKQIAANTGSSQ